ncbi:MAG: hypothetical protein V3V55_00235 [Rhodospirillales bacterium]
MGSHISYEIYSYKSGNWVIDSVHDDKAMALHQAKLLIGSPHHIGIRVIEESYDEASDKTVSKVIFKKQKTGTRKPKPPKKEKKEAVRPAVPAASVKKPDSFTKRLVFLLLAVCGIGLVLVAVVTLLMSAME